MALYDLGPGPKARFTDESGATGYEQNTSAAPSAPPSPSPASFGNQKYDQIGGYFSDAYGPSYSPTLKDVSQWGTNIDPQYMNAIRTSIYGSQPAQAYAQSKMPAPQAAAPTAGQDWSKVTNWDANTVNSYFQSRGVTPNGTSAQYWADKWNEWGSKDPAYFLQRLSTADEFGGGSAGGGAAGGGVFSDPATAEWEKALRDMVGKLNTPYNNPDLNPLLDYLRQYATQLQGPAYTPQQMDLLQTQALDPLTSQRDAERKRLTERIGARGYTPDSGIAQAQQNDLERQFQQLRSQREGQFAANAVNVDRQNQQLSGQVLAQIAALQEQNYAGNENRALQALGLLGQIPQYADRRLQLALNSLNGNQSSPTALLGQLSSFQNQGLNQQTADSNYWNQIGQALMQLFSGQHG